MCAEGWGFTFVRLRARRAYGGGAVGATAAGQRASRWWRRERHRRRAARVEVVARVHRHRVVRLPSHRDRQPEKAHGDLW